MIKFKYNPLNSKYDEIEFLENETLDKLILRICEEKNIPTEFREHLEDHIHIHVGGYKINKEFFRYLKPKAGVDVVVAVIPQGGDFGQVLKTVAIIAVVAVASVYLTHAAGATFYSAFAVGASGLAASLALNALIPPPSPGMGAGGPGVKSYEDSQTFTITSQNNSVNKFGVVPRVYGSHKVFPIIAANPYTDFSMLDGEQVQFFYAIYDFGYGPLDIQNIRIGETNITDYSDVEYRLVDLNKPAVSTGVWDDILEDSFTFYKGDIDQTQLGFTLKDDGDQATSSAAVNPDESPQEITVRFVASGGLNSFHTNGTRGRSTVELRVEFREVGASTWEKYGDSNVTSTFPLLPYTTPEANLKDFDLGDGYTKFPDSTNMSGYYIPNLIYGELAGPFVPTYEFCFSGQAAYVCGDMPRSGRNYRLEEYGFLDGDEPFVIVDQDYPVGIRIEANTFDFGVIRTKTDMGGGYFKYTFDQLIGRSIVLFENIYADAIPADSLGPAVPAGYGFDPWRKKFSAKYIPKENDTDIVVMSDDTQKGFYKEIKFSPITNKRIEVRVTRIRDYSDYSHQVTNEVSWIEIKTRLDQAPIKTTLRHTFLELRIKATDQINSNVQNLSAYVTSILDVYDDVTETWSPQLTDNPAWIVADLLTGPVNKRATTKDRLDVATFKEWADYCDEIPVSTIPDTTYSEPRYRTNFILDYPSTVKQTIDQVASAAQASFNLLGSKYAILLDIQRTTPVQMFTTRNTNSFSSFRGYSELPDYISVKYVDTGSDWDLRSIDVFNTGKDITNSSIKEDIDAFACTNVEQAFRYGRYMLAQGIYRQEVVSISVDFENLICTRGDFVLFQHDVMKSGGAPARVKAVVGNQITIDDSFTTVPLTDYGYYVREVDNTISTSTMTILNSTQATVDGTVPGVGDLIVWGVVGQIVTEWIVKSITPVDDLSAVLTLVEKNDLIYSAETTAFVVGYTAQLSEDNSSAATAPAYVTDLVATENSWTCDGSAYLFYVDLSWSDPLNSIWEVYEIYANVDNRGYQLQSFSSINTFRYTGDVDDIGLEVKFKVLAVNSLGVKKDLSGAEELVTTLVGKTAPPSDVANLYTNVTNETIQLDWDLVDDCDIQEYRVRFSPVLFNATWEQSTFLLKTDSNTDYAFSQARTGTYLIKAIDFAGRESLAAVLAVTSIPELFNLNVIEEINDFTALPGTFDSIEKFGDTLILKDQNAVLPSNYFPEGYYYMNSLLNIGEIYSCRLQAYMITGGFNKDDIIASWVTLAAVPAMTTSTGSDYSVDMEYRGTEYFNVMAEWTTMDTVLTMSGGSEDIWTNWRRFDIGDFTFRIAQFRIKLESFNPVISAQVFEGKIIADMPDRIYNIDDDTCPINGKTVVFDPAFKGPAKPNVQITMEDASSGDYWTLSNRTVDGFDIEFFDKNDVSVSRVYDAAVKGYGRETTNVI